MVVRTKSVAVKQTKYNEDAIVHHEGLDGVRQKPGMYLGERGDQMCGRILKEAVDNAYDEFLAGRNTEIEVYADPAKNLYIVADKAEGIPVGMHKVSKMSTLTLVMTKLHAGGKTGSTDKTAYAKGSAGTHGVGIAAANAVCSEFDVWTHRDGVCYHQSFIKGKPVAGVVKGAKIPAVVSNCLSSKPKTGTIVRMIPDQTVVSADGGKTKAKVQSAPTAAWLKNLAMMNTNLKVTFTTVEGGTRVFLNQEGIARLLRLTLKRMELEPTTKPVIFEDDHLSIAVQWTSYTEDDGISSYVSSSHTRDGGTHVDEFFDALNKAILPYKGKRDKYTPRDLRSGLVGIVNYRMSSPEFSSQVKDRLTSRLNLDLFNRAFKAFTDTFAKNKTMARKIIGRATEAKKAKEEFKKVMEGISKVNQSKRGLMLPNILASAKKCKASERELFLVEGDSAAGTAKRARDNRFQEVLRLTGKPPNAIRMPLAKLVNNKPVQNFLTSVGYDSKATDIYAHMRVERIFLLSDADPDGKHINVLILSTIWKMMPRLIEDGRVFICDAPLYNAYYKGQRYFGDTHEQCYSQMPRGAAKDIVVRAKGWGELAPETLAIIAFDPKTRNLIKVLPPKDKADKDHFLHLMGSDTAARKELLGLN